MPSILRKRSSETCLAASIPQMVCHQAIVHALALVSVEMARQDTRMGFSFKKSFIVGWGDCAPSGAVYYPNYFRWFDQSVWDLFDRAELPIPELEQKYGIVGLPLMNLSCSFRAPCRLRDHVNLETRIAAIEPKHFTIEHVL